MASEKLFYAMAIFAIVSFVSMAAGNVLLGISVLLYLVYAYKNGVCITEDSKKYYYFIGFFLLTMLLSAVGSGYLGKGLKEWADLWVWRLMPFVIITTAIKDYDKAKKILFAALVGFMIGVICVNYQGLHGDYRAAGFFGNSMTFGGYLCVYLPILIVLLFENDILQKYRWLTGVALVLGFIALIFNGTRGAWVALAPVLLFIMGRYSLKNKKYLILCLTVIVASGAILGNNRVFVDRVKSITSTTNRSNNERLLIWQSAYTMFRDHPVLGVGLGQYKDNYQQKYILPQAKEPYLTHAHNNFLQMLAENGIIGFVGFLTLLAGFIGYSFRCFWKESNPYALMMSMSTLALVLQGFTEYNFGNSAVMKSFWLAQGCLLILSNSYGKTKQNE